MSASGMVGTAEQPLLVSEGVGLLLVSVTAGPLPSRCPKRASSAGSVCEATTERARPHLHRQALVVPVVMAVHQHPLLWATCLPNSKTEDSRHPRMQATACQPLALVLSPCLAVGPAACVQELGVERWAQAAQAALWAVGMDPQAWDAAWAVCAVAWAVASVMG